ncbi:family 25 putative glycosyltransferase [Triangularia verruculosa]|uniref:Family 25 putative glycosyltransferase n=1 Tax=Triangularia verruculosa TaxID=2587418 RepID=A0AAN6X7V8_9PEZI|nr:family 25 putative glycosyltransferase [Triangularia verruculosa]
MLFGHRYLAFVVAFFILVFLFLRSSGLQTDGAVQYLKASGEVSPEILNATLGFQEIFVVNLRERTDRCDAMTLAVALTKLDVKWIDGIDGKDVSDRVLPGDSWDKKISKGNKGSWRAHMNALQRIVRENITSALILEDDADWDIRLKQQMQVFAQAARAFTQPARRAGATAKTLSVQKSTELSISQLPTTSRPRVTPYGDNWDLLWLGHCGTDFPSASTIVGNKAATSKPGIPLLRVTIPNDGTVPDPKHLKAHPFALQDTLAKEYPPHTRIVHASSKTTCTQAYAVSRQGARKLLYQFGLKTLTAGWDLMLGDWCDGLYTSHEQDRAPVCVTVQPPLFSHHYGKGAASDITAPGGGFVNKDKEMTPYIRLSVRVNMERMVNGVGVSGLVDQWPDPE